MPSVKTKFELKDKDVERIKQAITKLGDSSESAINKYLHNTGGEKIAKGITNYIPVSKRKKKHAKNSKWYKQNNYNLAVGVENSTSGKNSFYYLYYVATGTGTSKKNGPNDFMKKGMDQEYNDIVNGLVNEIEQNINKELKI